MSTAHKVYEMEFMIFDKEDHIDLYTANGIIDMLLPVLPGHLGRPNVVMNSAKTIGSGTYYLNSKKIELAAHTTRHVVVHEMAHWAADSLHVGNMGHGGEWRDVYVHLVGTAYDNQYALALNDALSFVRYKVAKS